MKIISRYILKEHVGPFVFALSALTSLLLLQYIARRFGDLVGRGLSWQIITEFFLLSIPFTLAMTLPMSVLVAVLYAFSRLASENEITALKAGGISSRALMVPAVVASTMLALFMLWFNDQLLPRSNHELATMQMAILRTKPTFALKPQVINTIREGQLYLSAGQIDEASGLMHDVRIYDLSAADKRRTIYADSGTLAFADNRRDLYMRLHHGWILSAPSDRPGQLNRVYYTQDQLKVKDVANQFQSINADTASKSDREMSVCEMQRGYESASASVHRANADSIMAMWRYNDAKGKKQPPMPKDVPPKKAGGIGALYCSLVTKYLKVKDLQAAELPRHARPYQDTTSHRKVFAPRALPATPPVPQQPAQQTTPPQATKPVGPSVKPNQGQMPDSIFVMVHGAYVKVSRFNIPDSATYIGGAPAGKAAIAIDSARRNLPGATGAPGTAAATPGSAAGTPSASVTPGTAISPPSPETGQVVSTVELNEAKVRLDDARHRRNRYGIEIQKKFSLATACIVFVLVGAPIALRFPRGGVGLVIGVSFLVFAIYYIGLIGGESLANKNIISPFWAMWVDNIIFLVVGLLLIARMGNEGVTSRGGRMGEVMDATRDWFANQGRRVGIGRQERVRA